MVMELHYIKRIQWNLSYVMTLFCKVKWSHLQGWLHMRDLNVHMFYLCLTVDLGQEYMFKLGNQNFILNHHIQVMQMKDFTKTLSLKAIQH